MIVSRFALPRVGGIIETRQQMIDGDIAEAQRLKNESDAALKAYETELAAARANAQAIGSEIRDKLNAAGRSQERKHARRPAHGASSRDAEKSIASTRVDRDGQCPLHRRRRGRRHRAAPDRRAPDGAAVDRAVDASLKG